MRHLKDVANVSNDLPCTSWPTKTHNILGCHGAQGGQPNTHLMRRGREGGRGGEGRGGEGRGREGRGREGRGGRGGEGKGGEGRGREGRGREGKGGEGKGGEGKGKAITL